MRISITKTKNFEFVYVIKDFYSQGSRTTKIVEKLGTMDELSKKMNLSRDQVISWAKDYAKKKTLEESQENEKISILYSPTSLIESGKNRLFQCGYLFLQSLYCQLRLPHTCRMMKQRHKVAFDLDAILADLIFTRILTPSSKASSYEAAKRFLEPPKYELHDVYRALSLLAQESDYIQAEVYKNSHFVTPRNNAILYYDCTNYFFEIEQEDGIKRYGKSKEHRPNPIVQMGLFMDGDGLPLAFDLFEGNRNEQTSLKPLEKKILKDFGLSRFVVCTDAGLGSESNRSFNSFGGRSFIVTQSLKKLKKEELESAMSNQGWKRVWDNRPVDLATVTAEDDKDILYYKEEPYTTKMLHQRMIITYSPKYAAYQKRIRDEQIHRALNMIGGGKVKRIRKNPNDPARFIEKTSITNQGEIADQTLYHLNEEAIAKEARFDGYYAICTDLMDDEAKDILKVSEGRWEIEESFRMMKSEFRSRPVYLQRDDRIQAHFLTCYLSLLFYRLLEKKLASQYTASAIIDTLRGMKVLEQDAGFLPAYKRTEITDALHETFGFRTDYQIITKKKMRTIIKNTKEK